MSPFSRVSFESPNAGGNLSTSAVFSRDATEKNGRRPQRWRDVRDSRPLFFPLFALARSVSSLSLSLSLSVFAWHFSPRDFFAPFCPSRAWCRAIHAKGENAQNKGVAKARLDANRWNRAQENAARVVFERRGARRRVGRRASASAFARLGFLVLGGPFI
jgi:hypothetical protein